MPKKSTRKKQETPLVLFADYRSGIANKYTNKDTASNGYSYNTPQGDSTYWGTCASIYDMYENDDMVGEFVDKIVDFVVGSVEFRHEDEKSVAMMQDWYKQINLQYGNILPTGDVINQWIAKSLVLTGLATVSWENGWDAVKLGKKNYNMPLKMTVYPSNLIKLEANSSILGDETISISIPQIQNNDGNKQMQTAKSSNSVKLNKEDTFPIKFRWSPLDRSLYPVPPLRKLQKIIALRNRLIDGDLSVLEDLIMNFNWFEIDADSAKQRAYKMTAVKNSDGTVRKESITDLLTNVLTDKNANKSFVLPPGWKFKQKEVLIDAIVNVDKYQFVQSAVLNAFGFMSPLLNSGNASDMFNFNMKRFENLVNTYRKHIELFYYWLFNKIRTKNPTMFKVLPELKFEPLRLDSDEYLRQIATLWIKGKLSDESSMEKFGFDYTTEVARRKQEEKNDTLFVPKATNPQTPDDMKGQEDEGGRPEGTTDTEIRKDNYIDKKKGLNRQL